MIWINIILLNVIVLIIIKYIDSFRSFRIYRPFRWNEKAKNGTISDSLKKLERNYDDRVRFYNFWFQIERLKQNKIAGAFAELGVYKGETAKIIHAMDASRTFHLFDTFKGFDPNDLALEKKQGGKYSTSEFENTSVELVKKYVGGNQNIKYHIGHFPETTKDLENEIYALVNIDADLYLPTLEACHYFYPLLSSGGVLIIHDYNHSWEGSKRAVDEFSATISESLIEIADMQGSVMIIKNVR